MIEPMHCTALDRKTACGQDIRGRRSTRQVDLVTCAVCQQRIIVEVVERARVRRAVQELSVEGKALGEALSIPVTISDGSAAGGRPDRQDP